MNQLINISPRLHPFISFHSRTSSRCAPPCSSSLPPSLQMLRPPGLSWRGWQRMGRRMHKQWWPRKLGLRRNGGVMLAKSYVCIVSDIFRYCMCADMLRIAVWKEEFPGMFGAETPPFGATIHLCIRGSEERTAFSKTAFTQSCMFEICFYSQTYYQVRSFQYKL